MAAIKKPALKVGEWVEVLRGDYDVKKGSLAVVAESPEAETDTDYETYKEVVVGYTVRIVFNLPDGSSSYTNLRCENVRKIEAPKFLVGWNTECNDPMMYFQTLTAAKAFVSKLKKRRGMGNKVVEVSIFTRN